MGMLMILHQDAHALNVFHDESIRSGNESGHVFGSPGRYFEIKVFMKAGISGISFSRRSSAQVQIPYYAALTQSNTIYPDQSLRSSDGSLLVQDSIVANLQMLKAESCTFLFQGSSISVSGSILALGFTNNALMSMRSDLGSYFYLDQVL
jgi:hypothetical protein